MAYTPTSPKPKSSGIDLSTFQGSTVNWDKLKAEGVQFAIIRAGYGDAISYPGQIDNTFERNYAECKRVGIPVGAYWFCYATNEQQAIREAESFARVIKGKQFELPLLYDVEWESTFRSGKTNEIIKSWADYMEALEYFVGVYIYRAAVQSYLTERTRTRYCMAIAEYGPQLNYDGPIGFWQNASTVRYKGIANGTVNTDHDFMYEDYPSIIKSRGKNGFPKTTVSKPKPAPKPVDVKPAAKKTNNEIADEVIAGKWGAGEERRRRLTEAGYDYNAVQAIVEKKIAALNKKQSLDEIAMAVIRGEWGAGITREKRLTEAGYDYDKVQKRVDELMSIYQ